MSDNEFCELWADTQGKLNKLRDRDQVATLLNYEE